MRKLAYLMKFSSSLLDALMGGMLDEVAFLPPDSKAAPPKRVVRTPMASCSIVNGGSHQDSVLSGSFALLRVWAGVTYNVRADLLASDLVILNHCGDR